MPKLAVLRASDGLLLEYETVAEIPTAALRSGVKVDYPLPSDRVVVPDACDLRPGLYRWAQHGASMAFLPVHSGKPLEEQPDALLAVWEGFKALQAQGAVKFPARTVAWIEAYGQTLDAQMRAPNGAKP